MKKLLMLLGSLFLLLTGCDGHATDVKSEMGQMAIYLNKLNGAETAEQFHQAAQSLREASVLAMEKQPSSIHNDADFKGYQQGMQQLIDALDKADQFALQGDLKEAKSATNALFQLKKEYHIKYK